MLDNVETLTATLTDDEALANDDPQNMTVAEAAAYLGASPRHALVISDLEEESDECVPLGPVYVMRGADDETLYYGPYPAEDPGDATQADSIERALSEALDLLCTG